MKKTLAELNTLNQAEFVSCLGGIYEHSPWMAERTWQARPFADLDALLSAFRASLAKATEAEQLALIRAHPDLAGKAALRGELTAESNSEQASAGLDQCTPEELARFTALNTAYQQKFGFPFIMAVKNATRAQILQGFEQRIHHKPIDEFSTALEQINRIAAFRLTALIE
ncbi:MAG: 2-oxo-4-hydroxy-4-carboxy-5-ureidoimidazoline decarboxylase [Thiothrix sp.]|nr:MAG: 2-oxo-4-hydroxy-4-carboxy-5-ureidoimidazoline decarboxylase [Thiothrix sp.]